MSAGVSECVCESVCVCVLARACAISTLYIPIHGPDAIAATGHGGTPARAAPQGLAGALGEQAGGGEVPRHGAASR